MELLTISRSKAARLCWRFHYYQYELGRVPIIEAEPLFFGTLFHVALEQWWLCWQEMHAERIPYDPDLPLDLANEAMKLKYAAGSSTAHVTDYDLVKCEELMRGYHCRWFEAMADLEIIAVESKFETPLTNPDGGGVSRTYRNSGKIDVRVRRRSTGVCWIVEHKTSTEDIEQGSGYWVERQMDGQITQYIDGARSLGDDDVRGCLYDVARRPMKRPKMATPEENRLYTQDKSCDDCRDKAQKKHKSEWKPSEPPMPVQASDESDEEFKNRAAAELKAATKFKKLLVKDIPVTEGCATCDPSHIYDNQREQDETVEEYRWRIRKDISRNPESYYQRAEIPRLEEEMVEFRFDQWELGQGMIAKKNAAKKIGFRAWSRNNGSCKKWNRLCDYHQCCRSGGTTIDNDDVYRDKKGQHEELGEG